MKRIVIAGLVGLAVIAVILTWLSFQPATLKSSDAVLPITPRPDGNLCWDNRYLGGRTWTDARANPPLMPSGIGSAIAEGDVSDSTMVGTNTFQVEPNTPLIAHHHIWYPRTALNTAPLSLRYLILLDEHQLTDVIKPATPYYDVTLQPGDEITLTLHIPALTAGIHDLAVIGLFDAAAEPNPLGTIDIADSRTTLLVGTLPQPLERKYAQLPAVTLGANISSAPPLFLTLPEDRDLKAWDWPNKWLRVSVKAPIDFNIYGGYEGFNIVNTPNLSMPERMRFALLAFMDYRQVNLTPDVPILYGSIAKDTSTRIAAHLAPPAEAGHHDILILRINNPGVPMCILIGPPNGQSFPFPIEAQRVGIDSQAAAP